MRHVITPMRKLLYLGPVATPYQVRIVPFMRKYFDAEYYFYDRIGVRQKFWCVELGDHAHILPCQFKWHSRYFTFNVFKMLAREKPEILVLGSFSTPANLLAYWWARRHRVKTIVVTERARNLRTGELHKYGLRWRLIHFLYRNVDMVMTTSQDIVPQFRDNFRFGAKVVAGRYPSDIDRYFLHRRRIPKSIYTIIFPNRLIDIYNPLGAVEIFAKVERQHPNVRLKMNASGVLRGDVEHEIDRLGLGDKVQFLDNIKNWDDLGDVYQSCDIMMLPAKSSNGNYTVTECLVSGMACVVSDRIPGETIEIMRQEHIGAVLPLQTDLFVKVICQYIENPSSISQNTDRARDLLRYQSLAGTAELYSRMWSL